MEGEGRKECWLSVYNYIGAGAAGRTRTPSLAPAERDADSATGEAESGMHYMM